MLAFLTDERTGSFRSRRVLAVAVSAALVACAVMTSSRAEVAQHEPRCLAGVCVEAPFLTEEALVRLHGQGFAPPDSDLRCYAVSEEGPFVRFTLSEEMQNDVLAVLISRDPNCPQSTVPKRPFRTLTTAEGLGIGDSRQKALDLYGPPDRSGPLSRADKLELAVTAAVSSTAEEETITYFGPSEEGMPRTTMLFRDGRLMAILMSSML